MTIRKKILFLYLLTLLPLFLLIVDVQSHWYDAQMELIESDRLNNARLVSSSFETLLRDLAGSSRAIGESLLKDPPDLDTPSRLTKMCNYFPLRFSAVLGTDGRVIYANDQSLIGMSIEDTAVVEAAGSQDMEVGNNRDLNGEVGFLVAERLNNTAGTQVGTAVQFFDPPRLTRRLARNPKAAEGSMIFDSEGCVVVDFDDPAAGARLAFMSKLPFVTRAMAGEESFQQDWLYRGEPHMVGATPVSELGWVAASSTQSEAAMAPFSHAVMDAAWVATIILAISAVTAVLTIRSLLSSVAALRAQSLTVGRSDVGPSAIVASRDELEEVSRSLRNADIELRSYIGGLERLNRTGDDLSRAVTTDDLETTAVRAAVWLFGAHTAGLRVYDERSDTLQLVASISSQGVSPDVPVRPGEGIAGKAFSTNAPVLIRSLGDAQGDEKMSAVARAGMPAGAAVPLQRGGVPFGVLGVSARGMETWRDDGREMALLRAFADQLAALMEVGRLYDNERFVADTLQQALLTLPDSLPGLDFHHAYHAATDIGRVGGDFYDLFEIGRDIGIVIGDVSGHGLEAAVMTSMVRNAVRAHSDEPGKSPAEVAELTNELVVKESNTETFVTLFIGRLDLETGTLTYCNAGHTTGVLIDATGSLMPLRSTAPIIGGLPGMTYEQDVVAMYPGATLVLYTDGVTEARSDGRFYGEQRVFKLLGESDRHDPAHVVDMLFEDVIRHTGGNLRDDMAILAVQRKLDVSESPITPS